MNLIKLLSTDFFTGQILFSGKGLLDILWFLLRNPQKKSLRLAALILQLIPKYTEVSVKRLINLHRLAQKVNRLNLPGDIVECGVWNGGSAAIMGVADRDDETSGEIRNYGSLIRFVGCHRQATKTENRQGRPIFKGGVTVRRRRLSEFSGDFGSRYSMSTPLPGDLMKHCRQQTFKPSLFCILTRIGMHRSR